MSPVPTDLLDDREVAIFLAARVAEHRNSEWIGVSSSAMIKAAVTGRPVDPSDYPSDFDDLRRCIVTYQRAPLSLSMRMTAILWEYVRTMLGKHDARGAA